MSKTLYTLNVWRDLCTMHSLPHPPREASPAVCREHYIDTMVSSRVQFVSTFEVAWGQDQRYWLAAPPPPLLRESDVFTILPPTVLGLKHVWWLHVTGKFQVHPRVNTPLHAFLCVAGNRGSCFGNALIRRAIFVPTGGGVGGVQGGGGQVALEEEDGEPPPPLPSLPLLDTGARIFNTLSPHRQTFVWLHLGRADVVAGGGEIEWAAIDTQGTIKQSVIVTHLEVLAEGGLSEDQQLAVQQGWAVARGPGGGSIPFL